MVVVDHNNREDSLSAHKEFPQKWKKVALMQRENSRRAISSGGFSLAD